MRTICLAGLALLVGATQMKHFIVETKGGKSLNISYTILIKINKKNKNLGQSDMEYTNDDDFVPPYHPPCQYGVKCTNTKLDFDSVSKAY